MNIILTPAEKNDMPVIEHWAKSFDLDCEEISHSQFIVAKKQDVIVGFGRLKKYPQCTEVATVGVIPEERNKGIGTAIVNQLILSGPPELFVTCVIPDFFSRFGFQITKKYPSVLQKKVEFCKYYNFKDDEIFVMKRIKYPHTIPTCLPAGRLESHQYKMAKQKTKKIQLEKKPLRQTSVNVSAPSVPALSLLPSFRLQSIFIVLIGCIIYFNSIFNRYALDDDIVMRLNDYVQQGFSGIGKIMTTDSYDSFFKSMGSAGELSGGRYRPLSIVTFALEQQLFGECYGDRFIEIKDSIATLSHNPAVHPGIINKLIAEKAQVEAQISRTHEETAMVRHIVSVLLYILSVVLLLKLLRQYIFKYANLSAKMDGLRLSAEKWIHPDDMAFITTLIFLVHPIHTEVISNVKSRDEILSFLFIVLTFIFVFKYEEKKKSTALYFGLLSYFLALLSKEWGITLMALIPLTLYIFRNYSFWKSIKSSLPYFAVAAFYLLLRYKFVGAGRTAEITEVLNNPFVYATPVQKLATEIFILLKYLRLLIFPHPLSADYSWQTIPYCNFGNIMVWLSAFIHLAMVYYLLVCLKKRSWLAFAIAFYLFHLFLVSNLAMPIGATMGERLIYHSSLGFAMLPAFLLLSGINKITSKIQNRKRLHLLLLLLLVVPMGYKTIARNPNWETDNILFVHDAQVVTNSVLANGNAGKAYIEWAQRDTAKRQAFLDLAIRHLKKAVTLHPKYVNGYLNLGLAYFQKKNLDTAEYYWGQGRKYFPSHPFFRQSYDPALAGAFVERAKDEGKKGNVPLAVQYISRALRYDSTNAEIWYHYGGASFSIGNVNEAYRGWTKCLQLNPNHTEAKKGMDALMQRLSRQ